MTTRERVARCTAAGLVAAAVTVGTPTIAAAAPLGAQPAHAVTAPYCEVLPMILIYPPPPTTVLCHTWWGDFTFTLPPGFLPR